MRTKAERRKNDYKKAIRKRDIAEKHYGFSYYDNLHQYSKNKIHCSCPMCTAKTKTDGRKHSEEARIVSMNEDERSFEETNLDEE